MHLLSFLFSEKVVKIKLIKEEHICQWAQKNQLFRGKSSIHTSLVLSINYHNFVKFLGNMTSTIFILLLKYIYLDLWLFSYLYQKTRQNYRNTFISAVHATCNDFINVRRSALI